MVEVLKQKRNSPVRVGCEVAIVYAVINGYLNDTPVGKVHDYELRLYDLLEAKHADLLEAIESGKWTDDEINGLKSALGEMGA